MERLNLCTLHKFEISSCRVTLVHICLWNTMTCEILCFRCINKLQFSKFNLYQWPWPLTLWNIRIYHPSIKNAIYYRITIESNIMHQIASCLERLSCSLLETINLFYIENWLSIMFSLTSAICGLPQWTNRANTVLGPNCLYICYHTVRTKYGLSPRAMDWCRMFLLRELTSFVTDYSECATIKRKADSAIYMFTGIQNTWTLIYMYHRQTDLEFKLIRI